MDKSLCALGTTFGTIASLSAAAATLSVTKAYTSTGSEHDFWQALSFGTLGTMLVAGSATAAVIGQQLQKCYKKYRESHPLPEVVVSPPKETKVVIDIPSVTPPSPVLINKYQQALLEQSFHISLSTKITDV